MEEELKNCPFCGGKAKKVWIPMQVAIPNITVGGFAISCSDCHAVQLIGANNEQDAINQWNNRFNLTKQVKQRLDQHKELNP